MTPPAGEDTSLRDELIDVGAVRLHCVTAGEGPLVILLHGFPDHWRSWREQLPALAAQGFRAVAPDLRGYNRSDKPEGVRAYGAGPAADDIAALILALGEERAHVVGHDWGGAVAYTVATRHPERVDRLVIVNCPHPRRFLAALGSPRQVVRSWYMLFFQLPWLPEQVFRAAGFAPYRWILRRASTRDGAFTAEEIDRYVEAMAQPGALTGGMNYYRSGLRHYVPAVLGLRRAAQDEDRSRGRVQAPTLVIWGDRDPVLLPELARPDDEAVADCRVVRLPDAAHWPHIDEPDRVNEILVSFLRQTRGARAGA